MKKNESKPKLKIIPLGGLHEIGKNTCVFEFNEEIILLDAGLGFPSEGMHGVNIVLPDISYLRENRHRIQGMIVTHGHEDHIGGIPYHLREFDIPVIYGPRFAMALLEYKLAEAGVADRTELRRVKPRDMVRIGKYFEVEFIRNTHSMADSFTVAIHTPIGVVIHSGDFKIDHTPVDGERFDFQRLAEHGEQGVLCLMSDSTNSEVPGFTPSESSVYPNLDRVISQAPGRVLITTFASSVHRINVILQLAQKNNRVVSILGRSMLNVIAHARNLGYIKCPESLLQPLHAIRSMPEDKILILTTGSQGEPLSAMTRIANKSHRQIKIRKGDTVVFSANPIPGNTISVVNTIDKLMKLGAHVVYGRDQGIHVSGHGCQEDQKLMLALTRPKFFLPVHGEHRMLIKHAQTAQSLGIPEENMVIVDNGDVIELSEDSIRIASKVSSGIVLVDNAGLFHDRLLKERQQLAEDGVVTIATTIGWDGKLLASPQLHLRGVVTGLEQSRLQATVTQSIEDTLRDRFSDFSYCFENGSVEVDWKKLQGQLEATLNKLLRRLLQSKPMLVLLIQKPDFPDVPSTLPTVAETTETPVKSRRTRTRPTAKVAS